MIGSELPKRLLATWPWRPMAAFGFGGHAKVFTRGCSGSLLHESQSGSKIFLSEKRARHNSRFYNLCPFPFPYQSSLFQLVNGFRQLRLRKLLRKTENCRLAAWSLGERNHLVGRATLANNGVILMKRCNKGLSGSMSNP